MALLNTHFYDGQLGDRLREIEVHLQRACLIPKDRKLSAFDELDGMITKRGSARHNLHSVIQSYRHSTNANYDQSNRYDASDMLWLCYELIRTNRDDVLPILEMQLEDMSSGMCSQGRTHRLLQVVCPFQEFLKE
jgi:hypothetical protein